MDYAGSLDSILKRQSIHGILKKIGGRDMDYRVGDIVKLKKPHPCGCDEFALLRVGMDFKLRCRGCGREIMVPRRQAEKSIRAIVQREED